MKTEYYRQAIHSSLGLILFLTIYFFGLTTGFGLTVTFLVLALIISIFLKYNSDTKQFKHLFKFFQKIVKKVERPSEHFFPGKGAIMFLLGILLTIIFFPIKKIVLSAIIVLALGDGTSTIFGEKFGKTKIVSGRSLEGTLAGMIVAGLILTLFYPLPLSLTIALIGLSAEYTKLNDNITIPIVTAIAIKLVNPL